MTIDFEGKQETVTINSIILEGGYTIRDAIVAGANSSYFTYTEKDYGKSGRLLTGFNGLETYDGKYWLYCINGRKATQGIDTQKLNDGDKITWKLTANDNPCE